MMEVLPVECCMDNLKIEEKQELPPLDISIPSVRARYPRLPDDLKTCNRHYVLGWITSDAWMTDFAMKYHSNPEWAYNLSTVNMALDVLELKSGFRHLTTMTVLPEGIPIPENLDDAPLEQVVALSFTASRYLFWRRPTRAQYKWLSAVFGSEPKWYRDVAPKEHWDQHGIY
ncbi:hypothetical protein B0H21DRAFT_884895 [Amylocystis lapponica]|nr:hypothetical protein B0H21DRAFT_884895 [Amylocystis lapponica]